MWIKMNQLVVVVVLPSCETGITLAACTSYAPDGSGHGASPPMDALADLVRRPRGPSGVHVSGRLIGGEGGLCLLLGLISDSVSVTYIKQGTLLPGSIAYIPAINPHTSWPLNANKTINIERTSVKKHENAASLPSREDFGGNASTPVKGGGSEHPISVLAHILGQ